MKNDNEFGLESKSLVVLQYSFSSSSIVNYRPIFNWYWAVKSKVNIFQLLLQTGVDLQQNPGQ